MAASLAGKTRQLAPAMLWPAVAARYTALAERVIAAGPAAVATAPA
ncbi:hypothetical protein [Phytohabitans aurantiacus]|jgi:hypothetical protein|uniref:Uncharacterized protein n=1 Tax=Phytohabitans aurantiacus TaxID=3016789 RepID=A0ABQ5R739_9ACTN|nr:hypothetical protein [Phytohabitans aurantiacus]GLI02584.1 hypothetical protein Pa4123_78620 [Phytohabitans aurantiacus]